MKKWFPFGVGGALVLILMCSWLSLLSPQDEISLQDFLHTDFSGITRIEVRYGDGNLMTIEDPSTIYKIVSMLKGIRLQKSPSPLPVGSLYYMDLTSGSQTVRYSRYVVNDHATYQSMDPQSKQLDEQILKVGRENIPGLLPGLEP